MDFDWNRWLTPMIFSHKREFPLKNSSILFCFNYFKLLLHGGIDSSNSSIDIYWEFEDMVWSRPMLLNFFFPKQFKKSSAQHKKLIQPLLLGVFGILGPTCNKLKNNWLKLQSRKIKNLYYKILKVECIKIQLSNL